MDIKYIKLVGCVKDISQTKYYEYSNLDDEHFWEDLEKARNEIEKNSENFILVSVSYESSQDDDLLILDSRKVGLTEEEVESRIEFIEDNYDDLDKFSIYLQNNHLSMADAENLDSWFDAFNESYVGEYENVADFAEKHERENNAIFYGTQADNNLLNFINWQNYWECYLRHYFWCDDSETYFFMDI